MSYPGYIHFRDHNQSFAGLAAFDPETPFVSWNRNGIGQSVQCQFVSGNFFTSAESEPPRDALSAHRRIVSRSPSSRGGQPRVLEGSTWAAIRRSSGDPQINGVSLTVMGVAPPGFTGLLAGLSPDLWAPYLMAPVVLHDPEWHTRTGVVLALSGWAV